MKITHALASLALLILPALSTNSAESTASYDPVYDQGSTSLSRVACSDGKYGLLTQGYTTFASLPTFPYIGGAAEITGWDSPMCGTCWNLTYTTEWKGKSKSVSINVLAIDTSSRTTFNIAEEAMNKLTGGDAVQDGVISLSGAKLVDRSVCGLK